MTELPPYCGYDYTNNAFFEKTYRKKAYIDKYEEKVNWEIISPKTIRTRKPQSKMEQIEKEIQKLEKKLNRIEKKFDEDNISDDKFLEGFQKIDLLSILNDDEEWEDFEEFED